MEESLKNIKQLSFKRMRLQAYKWNVCSTYFNYIQHKKNDTKIQ